MKTRTKFLGLLLSLAVDWCHSQPTSGVVHLTLNSNQVFRIPVGLDRVTTVTFPISISGLEGAFISQEPSWLARFQLSHQLGSRYFSARALATNVIANLNVLLGHEVCALELFESRQPMYVVEFARPSTNTTVLMVPETPEKPAHWRYKIEPYQIPGALKSEPSGARATQYSRHHQTLDYGDHWVRIEEVFCFDDGDTLLLRGAFYNKTRSPLHLLPAKSGVRVNGREFYFTHFNISEYLPTLTEVPVSLTITGASDDGRKPLSATDTFIVFLRFYSEQARSSTVEPPIQVSTLEQPPTLSPPVQYQQIVYQPVYPVYPQPVYYNAGWLGYQSTRPQVLFRFAHRYHYSSNFGKTLRFR